MTDQAAEIILDLVVVEADADAERLNELTGYLMRDLLELDLESVKRQEGDSTPDKAKGEGFTLGALALITLPTTLPGLITFLQRWTTHDENRKITIKTPAGLEVTFVPEKRLSEAELLGLVEKLTASSQYVGSISEGIPLNQSHLTKLLQLISTHFNEGELRTLCFNLGIEYDDLPDMGKTNKAREMVKYLERHNQIHKLLELVKQQRPNVAWEKL